jgi:Holliday junction resolvase RusA-like endonuclease
MHFHEKNALKKYYHDLVSEMKIEEKINSEYRATFVYHYKNKHTDLSNVCSLISKFALDALQLIGTTKDDTVMYCIQETYVVGLQDKEDPRVEIIIEEI